MYTTLLVLTMILNVAETYCDQLAAVRSRGQRTALWAAFTQAALLVPLIGFAQPLGMQATLIIIAVATVSAASRIPWYRALANGQEELSRLVPLLKLSTLFSVIVSFLFLDEVVSPFRWVGAVLITVGSAILGLDLRADRVSWRMSTLVAGLTSAAAITAINYCYKYLAERGHSFLSIFMALKLAQAIALAPSMLSSPPDEQFELDRPRLFVLARVLQTVAALIYVSVLTHVDLSYAVPLTAASPLLYLAADWALLRMTHQRLSVPLQNRFAALGAMGAGLLLIGR